MNSGEWRDQFDQIITPTTSPDGLRSAEEMRFDKLALFSGRPVYWTTNETGGLDRARQLMNLVSWCASLPNVHLGIYPRGLAQIVANIVATTQAPIPDGLGELLGRWALSLEAPPLWPPDVLIWGKHLDLLIEWLTRAPSSEFIWVTPEEGAWWIEATAASILEYGSHPLDSSALLALLSRHHCTLFAPFDGAAILPRLEFLIRQSPDDFQSRSYDRLADFDITPESLGDPRFAGSCWSWKVLEFGSVGEGTVVCLPQLALWSDWPASRQWAPPPPQMSVAGRVFTTEEAADYLDELLWNRLETVFAIARSACQLGLSEPTFGVRESRPPVFYFASPLNPPPRPEGYAEQGAQALQPIIRRCLNSDDPFAESVAWGTLEGKLVALRSERTLPNSYMLFYLLLPAGIRPDGANAQNDAGAIAASLGYLEFSIGHEARDVGTDLGPLQTRRALFGGSLDEAGDLIEEAIELFPLLSRTHGRYLNKTLQDLDPLMHRVQAKAEKVHSDSVQLQGKYDNYIDGTNDYFRRRVTFSPVPYPQCNNLRVSVRQAYPYEYFRQPLISHNKGIDEVRTTLQSLIASLNSFIEQANLRAQEQFNRVVGLLVGEIALLGLLVALPQLFSGSSSGPSTDFIDTFFGSFGLRIGVRDVAIGGLFLLLLTFLYFLILLLSRFFTPGLKIVLSAPWSYRHHPWRFHRDLQRLHEKVYQATQINRDEEPAERNERSGSIFSRARMSPGARLEQLDEEATTLLAQMWRRLSYEYRDLPEDLLKRWVQRERRLEYNLELFDLAPDTIPLPRALCIFRFKSTEFRGYTMIADWQFEASMGNVGFSFGMTRFLGDWLSAPVNQRQISEMDVTAFAQALKDHGISADPDKRKPNLWRDEIKDAPHSS